MTGSRLPPLRDFVPPILWRASGRLRRWRTNPDTSRPTYGQQQQSAYYDAQFASKPMLQVHYTRSHKYPLYAVIGDRVRALDTKSILDIGCGPGQVASLLRDLGVTGYLGVDFSAARIEYARRICPEFSFVAADVLTIDLLETHRYETLLAIEFLEHIEDDIALVRRIPQGVKVLFSVPNFPHESHVRYFDSATSVERRYGDCLSQMDVTGLLQSPEGREFFIVQGTR